MHKFLIVNQSWTQWKPELAPKGQTYQIGLANFGSQSRIYAFLSSKVWFGISSKVVAYLVRCYCISADHKNSKNAENNSGRVY